MFAKRQGEEKQQEFWIERTRVSKPPSQGFYSKLNEHLAAMDFARQVWALCEPAYREESRGGRPGIDPVVYFKMLMVGFFENLRSERAIAARCADSLSVRAFLGYGLEEYARSQQPERRDNRRRRARYPRGMRAWRRCCRR